LLRSAFEQDYFTGTNTLVNLFGKPIEKKPYLSYLISLVQFSHPTWPHDSEHNNKKATLGRGLRDVMSIVAQAT
jgi:hypothetical protein